MGSIIEEAPNRRTPTILVIEDEKPVRDLVADIFKEEGYQIRQAENGRLGLIELLDNPDIINLILLDLRMPQMDGLATLDEITKLEQRGLIKRIPIIMMTADASAAINDIRMDRRIIACFEKPFEIEDLLETVGAILGKSKLPRQL